MTNTDVVNDNNGNGNLDPGENAGIVTYITNSGNQPATNVQGKLRTTCTYISITDSTYGYGTLTAGQSANNIADPYDVQVQSFCPAGTVADFQLVLAAVETTWTYIFSLQVGTAPGTIIWGPKPLPDFPAVGFVYGVAFDRLGDRIYVNDAYGRIIHEFSSDSFVTFQTEIAAPDTNLSDIAYSRYDDKFYVTGWYLKQVWKINKSTGAVLRQFATPAYDYPVGLAFKPPNTMWYADRGSMLGATQLMYIGDTLGNTTQYNSPVQGYYNSRCVAYDSLGNTFIQAHTWFDASGSYIDSVGVVEYANTIPPTLTGRRFLLNAGWNIRGIEADPRDGNYWITIPQGGSSLNMIVKVKGFYVPAIDVQEQVKGPGASRILLAIAPNPATSNVVFQVNPSSVADLKIFDVCGRIVNRINLNAGPQDIRWNRRDATNMKVADGVYFVRVETEDGTSTQKLVLTH